MIEVSGLTAAYLARYCSPATRVLEGLGMSVDSDGLTGMLESFLVYAKLYRKVLPGSGVERVTVREAIAKWEKSDTAP